MTQPFAIVGSSNIDIISRSYQKIVPYAKNPGITSYGMGGVCRNIYENLLRLQCYGDFVTLVGNDSVGSALIEHLRSLGGRPIYRVCDEPTSSFSVVLDDHHDSYISISSMDIVKNMNEEFLSTIDWDRYHWIATDTNSEKALHYLFSLDCTEQRLFVDATSEAKAVRLRQWLDRLDCLKCTSDEFLAIFGCLATTATIAQMAVRYPKLHLIVTNRDQPIHYAYQDALETFAVQPIQPISTLGAGDSFSAGVFFALVTGRRVAFGITLGTMMAALTLQEESTVSRKITPEIIPTQ